MNLLAITTGAISTINPPLAGYVKPSTGAGKASDYRPSPTYGSLVAASFQVQALSGGQLRQVEALNLQGVLRSVYFNGALNGLNRPAGLGGDILYIPTGFTAAAYDTWLCTDIAEPWAASAGWTRVVVTLQTTPVYPS